MTTKQTKAYKDESVAKIASSFLWIETLETRNADRLDFHQVAVWQVKAALEAAFEAGRQTKR